MARVLLVTLIFSPDGVSTSTLLTELALELQQMGHDITVLTTTPHYNEDVEALCSQPLHCRWGSILYQSSCNGIPVLHAKVSAKSSRVKSRLLDYGRFHTISTIAGLTITNSCDVIIAPSPPLTIGISAWLLSLVRGAPFLYNVQEIYPDIAVRLGVLKNRSVIRLMERLESFIYKRSHVVVVISEWFRRRLLEKGVSKDKITVIPNFVDTNFIQPGDRSNAFSKQYGLEDKFVVLYAGNIGLTQNFENILETANRLTHLKDVCFLIVGDGARRSWLKDQLNRQELPNVMLLPYQPRSVIPQMYASSDVCLVPLKGGTAQGTFPSKIYTIMAAGRPAIVAADQNSELSWVTTTSGCGWTVPPDDSIKLSNSIKNAYHLRLDMQIMGQIGRNYVEKHHSKKIVAMKYDALIRAIVNNKPFET